MQPYLPDFSPASIDSAMAKVKYADPLTIDEVAAEHWKAVFHDNSVRVFKFPGWKELK